MEIKKVHLIALALCTLVICAFAWSAVYLKISHSKRAQFAAKAARAVQPSSDFDALAQDLPGDAEKLLDEIAMPSSSLPSKGAPSSSAKGRDWARIKADGFLRVALLPRQGPEQISGAISPEEFERALLMGFARRNDLAVERVIVPRFEDLAKVLLDGRADLVAASYANTPERRKLFAFTKPLRRTYEEVLVSSKAKASSLAGLKGLRGVIQPGTTYWAFAKALGLDFQAAPQGLEPEMLLARVASGRYPFTVAEDSYLDSHLSRSKDLKVVYRAEEGRDIAWAVRPEAKELLRRLNDYLDDELPRSGASAVPTDDLPEIKRRGYLRVITRNNPYCYFIHKGASMGFEYELVKAFAKERGLIPLMIVPPEWDDMKEWLLQGKGDIIAGNVSATPERLADKRLDYAGRYGEMRQVVAGRRNERPLSSLKDLAGRTIAVRRSSSFWELVENLRRREPGIKLVEAPEDLETGEILSRVASGEYDLTVSDSLVLESEISAGCAVKPLIDLPGELYYAWVVRSRSPELAKAVEGFFQKNYRPPSYRSAFYNIVSKRYFSNSRTVREANAQMSLGPDNSISPYDALFKRYAARYGLDWRLIVAQSYQESQFDPDISNSLGTQGLLQMMPGTARELGFRDLRNPAIGIHAGVRYLRMQLDRIASWDLKPKDRVCFALACYNAGYGHVLDARILAEKTGLDPNIWFGNVESALKLLAKPKYAARARFGYCNAAETVDYVRNIMANYEHYSTLVPE